MSGTRARGASPDDGPERERGPPAAAPFRVRHRRRPAAREPGSGRGPVARPLVVVGAGARLRRLAPVLARRARVAKASPSPGSLAAARSRAGPRPRSRTRVPKGRAQGGRPHERRPHGSRPILSRAASGRSRRRRPSRWEGSRPSGGHARGPGRARRATGAMRDRATRTGAPPRGSWRSPPPTARAPGPGAPGWAGRASVPRPRGGGRCRRPGRSGAGRGTA